MKNIIINKNFRFPKKLYEIRKRYSGQNCLSQEDIQIYFKSFRDRTCSFRFIVKNVIENKKFHFSQNLSGIRKKMLRNEIFRFKNIYKFAVSYFFT